MLRKIVMTFAVIGLIFMVSFPANADDVETTNFLTLDKTLWELQRDLVIGMDSMGFYQGSIYMCGGGGYFCIPISTNYVDLMGISFFNAGTIGIRGVLFPLVGIGFAMSENEGFTTMTKIDNNWSSGFPF